MLVILMLPNAEDGEPSPVDVGIGHNEETGCAGGLLSM